MGLTTGDSWRRYYTEDPDLAAHEASYDPHLGLTSAVFSGTFTGTYTLGGTVTIPGAALSGTFSGDPTFSGNPIFSSDPDFTGIPNFLNGAAMAGTFTGAHTYSGAITLASTGPFLYLDDTDRGADADGKWGLTTAYNTGDGSSVVQLVNSGAGFGTGGVIVELKKDASALARIGLGYYSDANSVIYATANLTTYTSHGIHFYSSNSAAATSYSIFYGNAVNGAQPVFRTAVAGVAGFEVTANGNVSLSSTGPILTYVDTDAAADSKRWQLFANGLFSMRIQSDDSSINTTVFNITRTTTTVNAFTLANGKFAVNDTTDATALTTASVTFAGGLAVASGKAAWFGGSVQVYNNLLVNLDGGSAPTSLAGGFAMKNGTAASAALTDGISMWAEDVGTKSVAALMGEGLTKYQVGLGDASQTVRMGGIIYSSYTTTTVAASGVMKSFTIPAGLINGTGAKGVRVTAWGNKTGTTAVFTVDARTGTTPTTRVTASYTSTVEGNWTITYEVGYVTSTTASLGGAVSVDGAMESAFKVISTDTDWTAAQVINFYATLTATDSVNQHGLVIELIT